MTGHIEDIPHLLSTMDRPRTSPFVVESIAGGEEAWKTNGDEMLGVFREAIGNDLRPNDQRWQATRIERYILSTETFLVSLRRRDTLKLAGFTFAFPAELLVEPRLGRIHRSEREALGLGDEEFRRLFLKTAEFGWTCITPSEQDKGGWSNMMETIEEKLRNAGYTYSARYVKQANNYADNVGRHYGNQVVYRHDYAIRDLDTNSCIPYTYFHISL